MTIKLGLNNLLFKGSGSPTNSSAAAEGLWELKEKVKEEGADVSNIPSKPMLFPDAVKHLETLGLLKRIQNSCIPVPSAQETALTAAHHIGSNLVSENYFLHNFIYLD